MNVFIKFYVDLFCGFLALWPRKWVRFLGWPLGILWFDILRIRRRVVLDNLKLAFPDWDEKKRIRVGRHAVCQMTGNFFEVLLIPAITLEWIRKNTVFEGETHLQQALAQGNGIYALSLHIGNGDIGAGVLAKLGYRVHLISKVFKNKTINNLWFYVRRSGGIEFINAHGMKTPFEILKAIKTNETVIFVNDQFMGKPFGIETTFFGRTTGTAFGLALFYYKTRSPVIPTYAYEGEDGKVHVVIEPPLKLEQLISEDKEQTYARITQEINNQLERIIRAHPEQWMWVHRRWKTID